MPSAFVPMYGVEDDVVVGRADDLDPVPAIRRDRHLRLDRGLETADGVVVGVSDDHDAVAAVRDGRLDRSVFVPTAVSVTCTPVALPPSSMPLPRLPETMQVRIRLLPPLEVIRIPSCLFGAAPPKAKIPAKVLNDVNPLAVPRHLDAVAVVAGDHVAERDHAADLRVRWKSPRPAGRRRGWPRPWRCWPRRP